MDRKQRLEFLFEHVRNISNFPQEGIEFKDVTPLFKEKKTLEILKYSLVEDYIDKDITKVVGIESRGFIMGPILALELGAGFVPIRKPGKLPAETYEESYEKEYGVDKIQIHKDALSEDDVVLIHDDLLATGGTMMAAYNLVRKMNVKNIYINFIIELEYLKGRKIFEQYKIDVKSLLKYK